MYDLSNPKDLIQQMRDGGLSDYKIVKTLRHTLQLFCVMCAKELEGEELQGNVCTKCSGTLPF